MYYTAHNAADKTVKVWDVSTQQCSQTLTHHMNKVQAVAWNPVEAPVLLSGGFDKQAIMVSSLNKKQKYYSLLQMRAIQ